MSANVPANVNVPANAQKQQQQQQQQQHVPDQVYIPNENNSPKNDQDTDISINSTSSSSIEIITEHDNFKPILPTEQTPKAHWLEDITSDDNTDRNHIHTVPLHQYNSYDADLINNAAREESL